MSVPPRKAGVRSGTRPKAAARVFAGRVSVDRMRKAQRYFGTTQPGVAIARAIEMAAEAQELAEALRAAGTLRVEDFDQRLS